MKTVLQNMLHIQLLLVAQERIHLLVILNFCFSVAQGIKSQGFLPAWFLCLQNWLLTSHVTDPSLLGIMYCSCEKRYHAGSSCFSLLQGTESWVGPGNKAITTLDDMIHKLTHFACFIGGKTAITSMTGGESVSTQRLRPRNAPSGSSQSSDSASPLPTRH